MTPWLKISLKKVHEEIKSEWLIREIALNIELII